VRPKEIASLIRLRKPQLRADRRALSRSVTVDDLRSEAFRRWPRGIRDYVEGGADGEVSLQSNRRAFQDYELAPAVLRDVAGVETRTRLFGRESAMPLVLAPTGYTRMMHADGEPAVARAAAAAQVPYTLSTFATTSVEDLARASSGDLWFQMYMWRDRSLVTDLLQRAAASGYRALMLTVDTAVAGMRVRDAHNGFTVPPRLGVGTIADMARHPMWCAQMLTGSAITFANLTGRNIDSDDVFGYAASQLSPSVTWEDLAFLREQWPGPLLVKGMVSPRDARRAEDCGIDGLVLSNHGGRQLDQVIPPMKMLPEVRAAVGDRVSVLVDSGVRRGSDVVIALALGADSCLIGRPYLYGLGAAGERGVTHCLSLMHAEIRRTMQLLGVVSVEQLRKQGDDLVRAPSSSAARRPASASDCV